MHMFSLPWYLSTHCSVLISWLSKCMTSSLFHGLVMNLATKEIAIVENVREREDVSLLDLPDLVLDCILGRLPPEGLYSMAGVSRSLRKMCISDHLWEKHMKQKWCTVIGPSAYREWLSCIASHKEIANLESRKRRGSFNFLKNISPLFKTVSLMDDSSHQSLGSLPEDSVMALYLSLETGKFSFSAQVYNRENGRAGFLLSCYDAEVCYDFHTNTFRARFSAHGGLAIEENIEWNRVRKPVIDMPSDLLHVSTCLTDLRPDNHIEIQWRRSKEFPYGWWYGVVGHLESCNGDAVCCRCSMHDTVVLEFTQFPRGSRWRRVVIHRKEHREVGNETHGFYGGIRKLGHEEEISKWKSLWPNSTFE